MTLPAFAVGPAMSAGLVLAQQPDGEGGDGGGQGEDFGKSSPVGLLLLLVFFVAVAFLVRSMTKHLKRVPASFDRGSGTPAASGTDDSRDRGGDTATSDVGSGGGSGSGDSGSGSGGDSGGGGGD
ncbi:hypothetical protein [Saccharomonospora piscinae]|uniref:hypothetical protein n=1 Tax=Saccharomonospora piscinae TaxID=687388 RepID=UPI0004669DAD|nr:hypothetical protein [Saccharomonospora piscinae]